MRVVVFGGNGFLGSHLCNLLVDRGYDVAAADLSSTPMLEQHASIAHYTTDIRERASVDAVPLERDDIVVNLAARQYHDGVPRFNRQAWFNEVNVDGLRNLLERMSAVGCSRLIFTSTDMVYGTPKTVPVASDHDRRPLGEYGRSKVAAEQLCADFRARGNKVTIFRPRLISGPGRLGVFRSLFKLIDSGLPVPLIGDGSNSYQMISVFDCATAIAAAVEKGVPDGVYNLGSNDPPTTFSLLSQLIERVDSSSPLLRTPAGLVKACLAVLDALKLTVLHKEQYAIANQHYLVDTSDTKRDLGWQPAHDDAQMITDAYDFYKSSAS